MSFLGLPPNIDRLKEKGDVDKLIEALTFRIDAAPKGAPIRQSAAQALGELRATPAVPHLFDLIQRDQSMAVRAEAVRALLRIGGRPVLDGLIGLLPQLDHSRETAEFRSLVIKALARIGEPAVPALLELLEQGNEYAQTAAAEALTRIGDPRAVRLMVQVCENTASPDVQHRVSDALFRFQNPAAVPELIITMHEVAAGRNAQLGIEENVARTALERMTRMAFGDDTRAWAAWWDEEGQERMMGEESG